MADDLITRLREQVDRQHMEALYAIEILSRYLAGLATSEVHASVKEAHAKMEGNGRKKTHRSVVLDALRKRPGAGIEDLVRLTGLGKAKIRGVLYAPSLSGKIESKVSDGVATYWLTDDE